MKIGVTTFHRATNYGAVMQAYALQNYLIENGHQCEIIDYRSEFLEKHISECGFKYYVMHPKLFLYGFKIHNIRVDKRSLFADFVTQKLILSDMSYTVGNIKDANAVYDCFITGSDQVWSERCAGFDSTYFLDFVTQSEKKNSYAASMGTATISENNKDKYREYLSDYNNIGVRESKGVDVLAECLNRKVDLNVDPVFLLPADKWRQLEVKPKKLGVRGYVLLYLMQEDISCIMCAKRLARQKGLKVIYVSENALKTSGVVNLTKITPGEWLYLIEHADSIVTNSFHGMAFSILFNKHLHAFFIANRPINDRVYNLLSLIDVDLKSDGVIRNVEINKYSNIEKLNELINKSRKYINGITGEKNNG